MIALRKTLLSAAVGVALGGLGLSVHAAEQFSKDLGPVQIGIPKSFNGQMPAVGSFLYTFTFTVPDNGGSGYSLERLAFDFGSIGNVDLLFTTVALYSDTDNNPSNGGLTQLIPPVVATGGGLAPISFTAPASAGGFRVLNVTGTTNGSLGGAFNGSISVSPVPEPETWAMTLIGLGLVGFQLRRRAKQSAAQRLA